MRYIRLFAIAAVMAVVASCMASEPEEMMNNDFGPQQEITIRASYGDPDTRTERASDGSVLWSPGDQISLFYGSGSNGGSKFTAQNTETAKVVNFTGTIGVITGGNDVAMEDTYFWATYPYCAEASCDGASITTVLPSAQVATADTFADDLFPSIGRSSGLTMGFYNICGGLKFTVSEEGIKSVTLQGHNNEVLAGKITVGLDADGKPDVTSIEDGSETIVLSAPAGENFQVGKSYYLVFVPTVFENGFTLTFSKESSRAIYDRAKKTTIRRSAFGSLTTPDANLEWEFLPNVMSIPPDNEIWYTTRDNSLISIESSNPFDVAIVSHTYVSGKGIIKCEGPITVINDHAFRDWRCTFISLPNTIERLGVGALKNLSIEELRIPDNLREVGSYAVSCQSLKHFAGNNTTIDGRCIILEKMVTFNVFDAIKVKALVAFAPEGVNEYTVPNEVEVIYGYAFAWCPELKRINFNEGLKGIMGDCFYSDNLDCDIVLPASLEYLDAYAFHSCKGIKGFYGNSKYHSADHMSLYTYNPLSAAKMLIKFIDENAKECVIENGIREIENYVFDELINLESVTVPASITLVGIAAFHNCPNIKEIKGDGATIDHRGIMTDGVFHQLVVTSGLKTYKIPSGTKIIAYGALESCQELEEVEMDDEVEAIGGYAFAWCYNLKKVTLSTRLKMIGYYYGAVIEPDYNPFLGSNSIEEIYFRSFIPPTYSDTQFYESDCSHLTVYVPIETLELYKNSGWCQYAPYMVGYNYDDIGEYYLSTEYSADGTSVTLQQSVNGEGIDLILMGDAFSDRQIADGTYGSVMQKAANAFFSEEPYKSMKDRFNVYSVNVVSPTEGYEHSGQALSTGHGDGTYVYGNDSMVIEYAKKAIGEDRLDDALVIVMMNEDAYAGTCFMYNPPSGDYGRGLSIAYFPTSSDTDTFNGLVSHEAGGHGFAKLADEYAYENMGDITSEAIANTKVNEAYGWWKNVDFTNDPTRVKWSQFLADERYTNEGLGCYEGGLTYWTGVWRPTENSIMRYNTGGFNAPSRYAIWYRIGKLAYGESWEGSYEDFVAYDQVNRTPAAIARRKAQSLAKPLPPLAPPVVVGHSWREELERAK